MSPVIRHTPMYRVWCVYPVDGENERTARDLKWEYGALDVANAARLHVSYKLKELGTDYWPVVVRVRELDTGKLYEVEVNREMVPEFHPGEPKEVT